MKFRLFLVAASTLVMSATIAEAKTPKWGFIWGSTDIRYSRTGTPAAEKAPSLKAWKGERVFAQAVFSTSVDVEISVSAGDLRCGKSIIPGSAVQCAFVGYVLTDNYNSTDRSRQMVADRLDCIPAIKVTAGCNQPIWFDIKVPSETRPGIYSGKINLNVEGSIISLPLAITVVDRTLPEPENWAFHLDLWQNPYSVAGFYNVPLWSEEHFAKMRPVMERYAKAGGKVITASIIRHPWNCQTHDPYESMIVKMKKIDGSWEYNYEVFDKWVEFMFSCGITAQIDCYTMVPWGYTFEYIDMADSELKTFSCKTGDPGYEAYFLPFLSDFAKHLRAKGWFDRTCIAMDERPMDQLRDARRILKLADPEWKIEGATDYSPEVVDIMYDISVAYQFVNLPAEVVAQRKRDDLHTTFYTCCGPERPNTFTFSPVAESTFLGLHAASLNFSGYLRWALNSWTTDPVNNSLHDIRDWHGGDCYLIYPEGSSMRFDRLVQGIQDYEKIRILREDASAETNALIDVILEPFKPSRFDTLDAAAMVRAAESELAKLY